MFSRRKFLTQAALGSAAAVSGLTSSSCTHAPGQVKQNQTVAGKVPLVISTWDFGVEANEAALKILKAGGTALDAVEQGVMVTEADADNLSVGYGGLPDRDGRVTLDACIMDAKGNCGSVSGLEHIMHPISVARKVMEKTPHVMLIGEGALEFALAQGFKKENLLTEKAKKLWEAWKIKAQYQPVINAEMHDTIGMVAIDSAGDIAGACTTSGLAYKMRGRIGDSPVIGAGMYVDNEVGGAAATGLGEAVLKSLGSFLIVELMRQGKSPQQACEEAIGRIVSKQSGYKDFQVGFLAVNKAGEVGGYAIQPGFSYSLAQGDKNQVISCKSYL